MISLKTAPVQSQRRKILLRGEARIRKALYEEYRVGSKHARRRNRGGGEICFGIMRLQTLRNSVSPNFIHSSSSSPIESTVTRMHEVNPPPSMATTEIHGVDAVSRLLVHPSVGRGRKRNTEFEGEEGYCGRREKGDKPLGTRGVQTVSSSSSSSREILRGNFRACCLVARFWPSPSLWFSRICAKRIVWSRERGDRIRLPCDFTRGDNKVVDLVWKWMKFVHLIFIYILDRAKGGSWNWLFFF